MGKVRWDKTKTKIIIKQKKKVEHVFMLYYF